MNAAAILARAVALLVAGAIAVACSDEATKGAPSNDGGAGDAAGSSPIFTGCRAEKFGAPQPLTSLNSEGAETALRLADDELSAIISAGSDDLYLVKRRAIDDTFGFPSGLSVNTTSSETHGVLATDGLLYFDTDRAGGSGRRDLWVAERGDAGGTFSTPNPISTLNTLSDESHPYIVGTSLYFSSDRTGTNLVYVATGRGTSFAAPSLVALGSEPSTEDAYPVVARDELELFFSSTRAGSKVKGARAIWLAQRRSVSDPFGAPTLVTELESDKDDWPTWLSVDGCRLYMVSDRSGSADIFVATRGS